MTWKCKECGSKHPWHHKYCAYCWGGGSDKKDKDKDRYSGTAKDRAKSGSRQKAKTIQQSLVEVENIEDAPAEIVKKAADLREYLEEYKRQLQSADERIDQVKWALDKARRQQREAWDRVSAETAKAEACTEKIKELELDLEMLEIEQEQTAPDEKM